MKVLAKQNISNIEVDIGELVEIKLIIFSTGADTDTTYDKRDLQPHIQSGIRVIHLEYKINDSTRFYIVLQ